MMLSMALLLGVAACGIAETTSDSTDSAAVSHPATDQTLAVETANNQFYTSLNAQLAGDTSPMQQLWSHADNVTCMGPDGGIAVGWNDVLALFNDEASLKLGGTVEPVDPHVTVGADLAVIECYELGDSVDAKGRSVAVRIRATNVFRKENDQWKMIGHHTDLLPSLANIATDRSNQPPTVSWDDEPSTASAEQTSDPANADSIDVTPEEVRINLED
jgi:ketosteroid isomerase-like protein